MNKNELITAVASKAGYTKADTTKAITALLDVITEQLCEGNEVKITGLGTFKVSERAARVGRNPITGESISIEARKAPVFKVSSTLKAAVKGE